MCGAVVGLAIGLNTYTFPPSYAGTVVAGAILAAVPGAIIGAAAGLACSHRLISRWR